MRPLGVLALLALVVMSASTASAATIELPEGRHVERALVPGSEAIFVIPLHVVQEGFLYAKLLVTPGNTVNDGVANGTTAGEGWAATFALKREGDAVEPLGTFVDSTPTPLVPIVADERPSLLVTIRVPEDAARGGPTQTVYIALAYRFGDPEHPGSTSGATLDESRSVVLLLSNALIPPVTGEDPGGETPATPAPVGPIAGGDDGQTPATVVVQQQLPTWFLVSVLAVGVGILILLALLIVMVASIWRHMREVAPVSRPVNIAVREPEQRTLADDAYARER